MVMMLCTHIQPSDINNGHKETCFVLLDLLGLLKTVI